MDKGPNLYFLFISHYKSKCSRLLLRVYVFSKRWFEAHWYNVGKASVTC